MAAMPNITDGAVVHVVSHPVHVVLPGVSGEGHGGHLDGHSGHRGLLWSEWVSSRLSSCLYSSACVCVLAPNPSYSLSPRIYAVVNTLVPGIHWRPHLAARGRKAGSLVSGRYHASEPCFMPCDVWWVAAARGWRWRRRIAWRCSTGSQPSPGATARYTHTYT